ncbi:MAG TPA: YncE family protein [Terriglobales bacterium]|nr:YncE family protein [Terriglobales bacterium]
MPIHSYCKLALALVLALFCAGCGDTFRPVATPLTGAPPDPQPFHLAVTVSVNTPGNVGSNMSINVSGDSRFSSVPVGMNPVHAAVLPSGAATRVYVANQADNTVSSYAASSQAAPVTTTQLPVGAAPNFVASSETTNMYVSMPGLNSVGVISVNANVLKATVPVGANPVALAETGDGLHLYSVNQGDNTVTGINTPNDSVSPASPIHVGTSPVWAVVSSAGLVYVLNQGDGTISVIQPGLDVVVATLTVAPGANYEFFESHLNRLYVTNPVANTVTVFDLSQSPNVLLATVPVAPGPLSVTALADGTRAYVVSSQVSGTANATVSVINASSNVVTKTIALPAVAPAAACSTARFRVSTASSPDSRKVYVANCDAGGTGIIRTSDDTLVNTLPSPMTPTFGVPQNPVWVMTTQ